MQVTVLLENTASRPDMMTEHGLSLYIETGAQKLLFDMGQTDLFARNALALGIDLEAVDMAFLSHGHYDHGGGLARFLELNDTAPIYASAHAFEPHYAGDDRYIGLDPVLALNPRFTFVEDRLTIDETLSLHSCNDLPRPYPSDSGGLTMLVEGKMVQDDFRHEQYLLIREGGRRILISGCSHKGILNIMDWFRLDVLIGGFHFVSIDLDEEGREILSQRADALLAYPAVYYTCHCTGVPQYEYLKTLMGDRLHYLSCGQALTLPL